MGVGNRSLYILSFPKATAKAFHASPIHPPPMNKALVILVVVIFVGMVFIGALGTSQPTGYSASDLRSPDLAYLPTINGSAPQPQTSTPVTNPWTVEWQMADVYASYGGVLLLYANNTGSHHLYIYGLTLKWDGTSLSYGREAGTDVSPGTKEFVGILPFGAPTTPGSYNYSLYIQVAIKSLAGGAWYDRGEYRVAGHDSVVLQVHPAPTWTTQVNPHKYYNDLNSKVDFARTVSVVQTIKAEVPGNYTILQVAEAYEWVRSHIEYQLELSGQDYWQSANETLTWGKGDCEDHAILIASIIGELGGQARVNIIEGHAFPTVYLTNNASELNDYWKALDSFYGVKNGSLKYNVLKDDLGYWIVSDTVGYPYLGGLPAESGYMETSGTGSTWGFTSSTYLYKVDATGQTSGGSFFGLF
jgi:hypothetical protein